MHPIEAISILSQLAYVQPDVATSFADRYAWKVGYRNLPVHAPTEPYTPLYHEFTYASNFRLEPDTPNKDVYRDMKPYAQYNKYYRPNLVGRQTSYERKLFLMTRDMAVLTALDKVKPAPGFYCAWNEDPIQSNLSEAAFKVEFNVNMVYPCTGPVHDAHVPKCVCPVPSPPAQLAALAERIKAHRAAAPFEVRLRDLYAAVADAHKAAAAFEVNRFPAGTLLANFTWDRSGDVLVEEGLGVHRDDDDYYEDYDEYRAARNKAKAQRIKNAQKQAEYAISLKRDNLRRAATARAAADAAEAELAAYIATKEDAAFAAFKPEVRNVLTTLRANALAGYTVPIYPIVINDLSPLLTDLDPPQNKWADGQTNEENAAQTP
jgi:hypothetical protein